MYELKFVRRHSTLIIPSLVVRRQSITASIQKPCDFVIKSAEFAIDSVDVLGETIRLSINMRLAVDFLRVLYIEDKQTIVFNYQSFFSPTDAHVNSHKQV